MSSIAKPLLYCINIGTQEIQCKYSSIEKCITCEPINISVQYGNCEEQFIRNYILDYVD